MIFFMLLAGSAALLLTMGASVVANRPQISAAIVMIALLYDTLFGFFLLAMGWLSIRPKSLPTSRRVRPTISTIVPTWNDASSLSHSIDGLLSQSDQPELIIVVDDGSTDGTYALLMDRYQVQYQVDYQVEYQVQYQLNADAQIPSQAIGQSLAYQQLIVLKKSHTGKADSLNQAIGLTSSDVVMTLDADTWLYPGSVAAVREAFTIHPGLSAVVGVLIPSCSRSWSGRIFEFLQRYEYVAGHTWRLAWSYLNASLLISGACGAYRRQALLAVGGFNTHSWAEDYELVYRMHKQQRSLGKRCEVMVQSSFKAMTEAPQTIGSFLRQRRRWFGGFVETLFWHRAMVGQPRFGALGMGYLVHNTLVIMQPLGLAVLILAGIFAAISHPDFFREMAAMLGVLVLAKYGLDTIMALARLWLYRTHTSDEKTSYASMLVHSLLAIFLMGPLIILAQFWGYLSLLTPRRNW